MNALSVIILAFSMSADAFAVAICKGAAERNPRWTHALKTAAIFGIVEAISPLIGWCIGAATSVYITKMSHVIVFAILNVIGLKLLYESYFAACELELAEKPRGVKRLLLTACTTSIDALAVGVSLALMDVNIWFCAITIGSATFIMVTIGMMMGHHIGKLLGKLAEAASGVALMAVGTLILCGYL